MNEEMRSLNLKEIGSTNSPTKKQVFKRTTDLLHKVGIPASVLGYGYLRASIVTCYFDKDICRHTVNVLYPNIAEKFKTTPSRLERAMRHAIEIGFDRGDIEAIQNIFKHSFSRESGRPTIKEFITLIADELHIEFDDYDLP